MIWTPKLWTPSTLRAMVCAACGKPYSLRRQLFRPMLGAVTNIGPCACCGGGGGGDECDEALVTCGGETAVSNATLTISGCLSNYGARFGERTGADLFTPTSSVANVTTAPTVTCNNGITFSSYSDCLTAVDWEDVSNVAFIETECLSANLNGSYSTSDITDDGFGTITATFHVGTPQAIGETPGTDLGILFAIETGHSYRCCGGEPGEGIRTRKGYVHTITATYDCAPCDDKSVAGRIQSLSFQTQLTQVYQGTEWGSCTPHEEVPLIVGGSIGNFPGNCTIDAECGSFWSYFPGTPFFDRPFRGECGQTLAQFCANPSSNCLNGLTCEECRNAVRCKTNSLLGCSLACGTCGKASRIVVCGGVS
jgi:hypothetical protein